MDDPLISEDNSFGYLAPDDDCPVALGDVFGVNYARLGPARRRIDDCASKKGKRDNFFVAADAWHAFVTRNQGEDGGPLLLPGHWRH